MSEGQAPIGRVAVAAQRNADDTLKALEASRERLLAAARAGRRGKLALARATAARMIAAWTLMPAPHDPVAHVEAAHAQARIHLGRLTEHPPAVEVPSVMTADIFAQLTNSRPPAAPGRRYTYTPRKVLRRVLDHGLDHLNQIDQWLTWQRHGVVPTPTDGWASSLVTLPGDRLPLAAADLAAWLWRPGGAPAGSARCWPERDRVGLDTTGQRMAAAPGPSSCSAL